MRKRTIKVTVPFNMSEIPANMITSKEKVKEMVEKDMVNIFGWDEGYCGVEVEVIDE
jgi:hypothetical protein